jgi:hypothetical protein
MEQSEAERQLVGLLRGLDVPEFSLQISIKEKRSDPLLMGGRGWHLLEQPTWTVTMAVPQVPGQRTTMSDTSFARAWQLQELWWRSARKAPASGGVDYRQAMAPDSVERAESQLLSAVRGEAGGEFAISIAVKGGRWLVSLRVPGGGGRGSIGDGASFAYAWLHDWPWWRDLPEELRAQH